ncbi:MAG: hypothetical protein HKO59_02860 [Phycisphaerales bacterium]|nr:hypothetical protein [Phycisphaerae bacterium]NNF43112.1 hypothetical protein [Phycisphaerales bacterium]NNM24922.1 hypothetical protein [Phycisphaerales bacterium]
MTSTTTRTHGRTRLRALLVLNGCLLLLLGIVSFSPPADAQYRVRGKYMMAAGGINGSISDAVYILDTTNRELIALTYEPSTKELIGIGYRNLVSDTANVRSGINR